MNEDVARWVSMAVVVLLSIVATLVFFGILQSTGEYTNHFMKFGGAAAGGIVIMLILLRYDSKCRNYDSIKRELSRYCPTQGFQVGEETIDSVIRDLELRHRQYGRIIPFHIAKEILVRLFHRNTFQEIASSCPLEDWNRRFVVVHLTHMIMSEYRYVIQETQPNLSEAYNVLITNLNHYRRNLKALFIEQFDDFTVSFQQPVEYSKCIGVLPRHFQSKDYDRPENYADLIAKCDKSIRDIQPCLRECELLHEPTSHFENSGTKHN